MMKRLTVLILVLALTSAANAVLIQVDGQVGETFDVQENAIISVVSEDALNWLGYLIVEEGGLGDLSNPVATALAGDPALSGAIPYTEAGWGSGYEMTVAGSASFPVGVGTQFTFDYTGALGDTARISLFVDPEYGIPAASVAVNVVPEPMTILLLGLGGLLLRRLR
ncbi:MAG: PEP-CTERM sorting domain-containing protein [Planctomycetota bacterium]|jgi:hypothetical protein